MPYVTRAEKSIGKTSIRHISRSLKCDYSATRYNAALSAIKRIFRMRAQRPLDPPQTPVFRVNEAQKVRKSLLLALDFPAA